MTKKLNKIQRIFARKALKKRKIALISRFVELHKASKKIRDEIRQIDYQIQELDKMVENSKENAQYND